MAINLIEYWKYPELTDQTIRTTEQNTALELAAVTAYKMNEVIGAINDMSSDLIPSVLTDIDGTDYSVTGNALYLNGRLDKWEKRIANYSVVNVKEFGATGDGVTDETVAIKAAIDAAMLTGQAVYFPSGVYMCQPNQLIFYFTATTAKTFCLFGDGAGSIIKIFDDTMAANYMRVFTLQVETDMDLIEIGELFIDHNARGSDAPPSPMDYQQSHTIQLGTVGAITIKKIYYHGVTVKDPGADAFNRGGTDAGVINDWSIVDCSEIDRIRERSSIQTTFLPNNFIISNFTGDSIECETPSTPTQRNVFINNVRVKEFDLYCANVQNEVTSVLSYMFISNSKISDSFLLAGIVAKVTNCDIRMHSTGEWNWMKKGSEIVDSVIRIRYNADTGVVTPFRIASDANVNAELILNNCRILLDYVGTLPVAPTGFMITASIQLSSYTSIRKFTIKNCYFDPRALKNIECYRNGQWYLINNTYSCITGGNAVYVSVSTNYWVEVFIQGGDCSNVAGDFLTGIFAVRDQTATIEKLTLIGDFIGIGAGALASVSGIMSYANGVFSARRLSLAALPVDGIEGDVVTLLGVAYGTGKTYLCTTASVSGTAVYRMVSQNGVKKDTTANRPAASAIDIGLLYLDTTLDADGKPIWYNGTAWVDATGAAV